MRSCRLFVFVVVSLFAGNGAAWAAGSSALSEDPRPLVTEQEVKSHKKQGGAHHDSGLSNKPAPLIPEEDQPKPTPPIFQRGEKFLAAGNLTPGITLPTGAIWQPALWVFGDFRSTIGHFDNGVAESRQFQANRLDLFFNLKLTPTERVLLGISPLSEGAPAYGVPASGIDGNGIRQRPEPLFDDVVLRGRVRRDFPQSRSG